MIDLTGRRALVTGASRGIGRAIALALAKAGADVALNFLNSRENAEELAEEIGTLGRKVILVKADMGESEDVANLLEVTASELGGLDIAVSNAAGGGFRPLLEVSPENLDHAIHLNVRAFMLILQHGARHLERRDGPRSRVLAISSWGAERALPMYGAIGASKAALESMVRHGALELGPRGVNVNCVRAGVVDTGALRSLPGVEAVLEARRQRSLAGERNLTPEDVANAVLFLSSPLADMIQGQTLIVDGGTSLHP